MAAIQENSFKFSSLSSSSENEDPICTAGDEEFYEDIEAPKFVDFTSLDHYRPDDRYWFCQRVGCNQKHEEEMDSEAVYKNFVLKVMAARSPNVRLKKALDRDASRTPIKCPLSAPPKSSRTRLTRLAIISSFEKKKRVIRPVLKPESTPVVTKTKPVASKYLTTPRNKKCLPNINSFRSVQNPKPTSIDVCKSRMVAKALVFHSPKKAIKVKTSVELRTPITKLCEGMKKLEISSQRRRALVSSSKSSKNPNINASSCTKKEVKRVRFCSSTNKGMLSKHCVTKKLIGNDNHIDSLKTSEDQCSKRGLVAEKITDESELQESRQEKAYVSSAVPQTMNNLEDLREEGKCEDREEINVNARFQATNTEANSSDGRIKLISSENCANSEELINEKNSSEGEKSVQELVYGDDKENATASLVNRMHNTNLKQNRIRTFGVHEMCETKKVVEAEDKHLKEGLVSSGPVLKFKKPKPTNPKPFRLRTEERGILREANLEKRTNSLAQNETANLSTTLGDKLQRKQANGVQKGNNIVVKNPKRQESHHALAQQPQQQKLVNLPLKCNSIQRLEKMRKIRSPLQPHGLVSTKEEMKPYLVPGEKLDVIHEASQEVLEQRRETVTLGAHHAPRSCCTKKLAK